jgi:putative ABC transport system permease protein
MRVFASLRSAVSALFHRSRVENEMEEELRAHIQDRANDLERSGVPRAEAERRARLEFGGYQKFKEEIREAQGTHFLETLIQDLRYALRKLRKSPGFTAVAVLTLALGIGANAAIFSAVNGILLEPLPYANSSRLLILTEVHETSNSQVFPASPFSPPLSDILSHCPAFERVARYQGSTASTNFGATILGGVEPESATMARVSADFFPMLGTRPILGRYILAADTQPGNDRVTVLNYRLWRDDFGGDLTIVGKSILINKKPFTIIGVMPQEFDLGISDKGVWIPLVNSPRSESGSLIARLRRGANLEQANSQLRMFSVWLGNAYPQFVKGDELIATSVKGNLVSRVATDLLFLLGAAGFVLMISCVNVAALLVARACGRQKEIAIRKALGAARFRIVRQLLTESILLAIVGGALGLLLSIWGIRVLRAIAPPYTPRMNHLRMDAHVLWFTLGISLLAAILFGLTPALQATSRRSEAALKGFSGHSYSESVNWRPHRLRRALVIVQVALAVILVIGAALMARSFDKLIHVDTGIRTDHVLTMKVWLSPSVCNYNTPVQCELANQEILSRIQTLSGVQYAAISLGVPMEGGYGMGDTLYIEGRQENSITSESSEDAPITHTVTPDYFSALGIRILEGRDFNSGDTRNSPHVAIVNQSFARRYLPGNALGKRFSTRAETGGDRKWTEVVGVVSDDRDIGLAHGSTPLCYFPATQGDIGSDIIVRTTSIPMALAAAVKKEIWEVDKNAPVSDVASMNELVARQSAGDRFLTTLLGSFGALGLLLAVVGIYGVISYSVVQRTHEIGVRMALGAQPVHMLRMVIREGMLLAVAGLTLGIGGALALGRVFQSLLFEIKPTDPATFIGVAILLTLVAFAACYIPARRATRVDPMVALRYE